MTDAAFAGLRVVDLSDRLSGAWCARLFADMGADVLLAEPPAGHALRFEPPFVDEAPGAERSLLHAYANWNKRSVIVDGAAATARLAGSADLLITTALAPWPAIVQAAVEALPADAVHVSITPHGLDGPLATAPGNNLTGCARSGWTFMTRFADEPPLQLPARQTGYLAGVAAFTAAAAAVFRRARGGGGMRVDASELEALCSTTAPFAMHGIFTDDEGSDYGFGGPSLRGGPTQLFAARDGQINLGVTEWNDWPAAMQALSLPDLANDPDYAIPARRRQADVAYLRSRVADAVRDRDCTELMHRLLQLRCLSGVMQDMERLRHDEQLAAREFFVAIQVLGREASAPGPYGQSPQLPWAVRRPAPSLGQLSDAINAERRGEPARAARRETIPSPPAERPLAGVRVLAFTPNWAGPWASELLALLGADVVQIEAPTRPDRWRGGGDPIPSAVLNPAVEQHKLNTCPLYNTVNLGKRSLTLNMTHPRGAEIFWRMLPAFDIVMENFSPHVMRDWGISLDRLAARRPGIIWASSSGYGATGPFADYPAYGASIEPMSGLSSIHGYEGDGGSNTGGIIPDPISGYYFAAAVLSALNQRERTGEAIRIDLGMHESVATHVGDALLEYEVNGHVRRPAGNRHPRFAPHSVYPAADGEWLALAAESDAAFAALAVHMGRPELAADPRFNTESERKRNETVLDEIIAAWCRDQDATAAEAALGSIGVCAARARRLREVFSDPHPQLLDRKYLRSVRHPESGDHRMPLGPWRLGDGAPTPGPSPCFGEHSREILHAELGISDAEYAELLALGVTGAVHDD